MKKTVLIVGISSFTGSNLAQILRSDFRVVGTYLTTPVEIPGISCIPCDVMKKDQLNRLITNIKPDFVIYALGMHSMTECKLKPKLADALNSGGAINCMLAAERNAARFIYLSSGFVMEGKDVLYKESDTPFPASVLGTSLSSTEFYIQRSSLNYFILRCPVLYGRSVGVERENFFEVMQRQLSRAEIYSADGSVVTGYLDVSIAAEFLRSCMLNNVTNRLLQVSSSDWMSRFDFARKYTEVFKKDESLVQRVDVKLPLDDNRSKDRPATLCYKLDTTNIESLLGTKMPSIEESLRETLKRLNSRN